MGKGSQELMTVRWNLYEILPVPRTPPATLPDGPSYPDLRCLSTKAEMTQTPEHALCRQNLRPRSPSAPICPSRTRRPRQLYSGHLISGLDSSTTADSSWQLRPPWPPATWLMQLFDTRSLAPRSGNPLTTPSCYCFCYAVDPICIAYI
jgi:hypothetical protein